MWNYLGFDQFRRFLSQRRVASLRLHDYHRHARPADVGWSEACAEGIAGVVPSESANGVHPQTGQLLAEAKSLTG